MQNEEDIQKKFETLPQVIKEAITSVDFAEKLQSIGRNSNLHLDQLDLLFEEVGYVMLGETRPQDFNQKIADRLGLRIGQVGPLVKEVDEQIFRPIRTSLFSLHDEKQKEGILPVSRSSSYREPLEETFAPPTISTGLTPSPLSSAFPIKKEELGLPTSFGAPLNAFSVIPPQINKGSTPANLAPQTLGEGLVITPAASPDSNEDNSKDGLVEPIVDDEIDADGLEVPHRKIETTNPHKYLAERAHLLESLTFKGTSSVSKKSLAEEAFLVAKQKTENLPLPPKIETPSQVRPKEIAPHSIPALKAPTIEESLKILEKIGGTPINLPSTTIEPKEIALPKEPFLHRVSENIALSAPVPVFQKVEVSTPPPVIIAKDKLTSVVQAPRATVSVTVPLTPIVVAHASGAQVDPYREQI